MTYQQTLDYLFSKLPMYQRKGSAAYKADIGNIVEACKILKNPHQKFKSIHIAGTNGKGSTAHMLASILQESGYKVGLYTSPHLKDFRERIKINGEKISENSVIKFVEQHKIAFENISMSFFEYTVAMAFDFFSKEKVDIAIIETGLGGRLDSTNIINPELSIITNIGLDHTNLLGNTIEKIATEKAGIIKPNISAIIGRKQKETQQIFKDTAKEKNSKLIYAEQQTTYSTDLKGRYQKENINTTVAAVQLLSENGWSIKQNSIKNGLLNTVNNTGLLGRWQMLQEKPLIICDTGHNEDGIKQISKQLKNTKYEQLHFVFGTVNDKNLDSILSHLPKNASYYFCQANIPRAMDAKELQQKSAKYELKGNVFTIVKQALSKAKENANASDLIFVGGSTFVVAEAL
jgi:dihydrofolate synthase/folylpolyglutamate synthase